MTKPIHTPFMPKEQEMPKTFTSNVHQKQAMQTEMELNGKLNEDVAGAFVLLEKRMQSVISRVALSKIKTKMRKLLIETADFIQQRDEHEIIEPAQKVQFNITVYSMGSSRFRSSLKSAMGLNDRQIADIKDRLDQAKTIEQARPFQMICTAEQFAALIIIRNNIGGKNDIRSLNAKFIDETQDWTLNVSDN